MVRRYQLSGTVISTNGKPLEARDRILAHIRNSRVEIIEGSAHDLLFHRPGVVMPHILDFLRSNEPAAV